VTHFDLRVNTYERVVAIDRQGCGGFVVRTRHGGDTREYRAAHVVMAVGDMHHPRLLQIPGEELHHVSHYFDEPHAFFQQDLLIVGGRNSAVEAAIRCFRAGARVTLSYRKTDFDASHIKYWLLPEIRHLIRVGSIRFHGGTVPVRITPTHVTLADVDDSSSTRDVKADFALLLTGYEMDPTLFEMAGCKLVGDNKSPQHDEATMETDVPGLFVAGTAAAGTQVEFRLFIENCHVHVDRIFKAITGRKPDRVYANTNASAMPES
jgi:thioredoxin reductase (NADPH)